MTLNARERATIGVAYKKEVAGAELAAVKAVAPARKTSMVATAEANGVYHVKVTGIVADLGILGGEIKFEATKASPSLILPATLKKRALRGFPWPVPADSRAAGDSVEAAMASPISKGRPHR